ncbi:MAG: hypothetical protein ABJA67_13415 [Chthonomonadales bacterium]
MKKLTTFLLVCLFASAASFAVTGKANAQLSLLPSIRVKAGLFLPSSSTLTNAVGNTWIKLGVDVGLPVGFNIPIVGASTHIGIDYAVKGSSSLVPITLMEMIQPSAGVRSPIFGGIGLGMYTAHFKGAGSATRLGYRLMGGFEFNPKFFIEAQYDVVGQIRGTRADGISVLVGTHF